MTDDYKHISSFKAPKTKSIVSWSMGLLCLVIGSLSMAAWLRGPPVEKPAPAPDERKSPAPILAPAAETPAEPAQVVRPARPDQPDFEFYTILPRMEVPIPKWAPPEIRSDPRSMTDADPIPAERLSQPKGGYYLQAGSFQSLTEANSLHEHIEKLGLPVEVQTVRLSHQGEWHRVRSGPFSDLTTVDRARERLLKNGIHFILLKQINPITAAEKTPPARR